MTATIIDTGVRWRLHASCPSDWSTHIERCGAGLFHSPAGLAASGEQGDPFYAKLVDSGEIIGIAVGVQRRCRVPPLPRHAYLPSPPALVAGARVPEWVALDGLLESAGDLGWTDVTIGSMEADGEVPLRSTGMALPTRQEYDIPLAGTPSDLEHRLTSHHRRRLPADGLWTLRTLAGPDARRLLAEVTRSAQRRAWTRRRVFNDVSLPPAAAFREDPAWGLTTYAVMLGEKPLAAALVGWAGKRAYYVSGGSTPEGYECNASVWMHLQIALAFQAAGFTHYSLGGAPASAANPGDPSHGLHRFKTGFGATVRLCAGARWVFGAEHEAGHRFTRWIRDHIPGPKETP